MFKINETTKAYGRTPGTGEDSPFTLVMNIVLDAAGCGLSASDDGNLRNLRRKIIKKALC